MFDKQNAKIHIFSKKPQNPQNFGSGVAWE